MRFADDDTKQILEKYNMHMDCQENSSKCPEMCLAYSYVLPQTFSNIYSVNDALCNGTLFKELNLPITVYGK